MMGMNRTHHKIQQMQLKIAFHTMGGESWIAGQIYLRNLFYALQQTCRNESRLFLLVPAGQQNIENYAHSTQVDGVISYNIPQRWHPLWAANGLVKRLSSRDIIIERVLRKHRIKVLFSPYFAYKYPKIATLSWLPDFQHVHLPEMFSEAERLSNDRIFLRCARLATRVISMSDAVRKDFESFTPMYAHKAKVLRPVSYVPQSIYEYDLPSILNLYHLCEKFVYLPNQFWKHKNHELVFGALKILKDKGIKVIVVCSGYPADGRHPTYFTDLWQKLSQWDIRDQVIYLGLIPHEQVLLLMRQSICVLNPSLFEGWGTTVDEARSVGKQVLLSEIPAHREQNPPKAKFFDPRNCNDLTETLGQTWVNTEPGPDIELESEARYNLPARLRAYAEAFVSVAREAVQEVGG